MGLSVLLPEGHVQHLATAILFVNLQNVVEVLLVWPESKLWVIMHFIYSWAYHSQNTRCLTWANQELISTAIALIKCNLKVFFFRISNVHPCFESDDAITLPLESTLCRYLTEVQYLSWSVSSFAARCLKFLLSYFWFKKKFQLTRTWYTSRRSGN